MTSKVIDNQYGRLF